MAEVVGTAYVVIRAITTRIASDIKDGIDKGAADADVDSAGEKLGDRLGAKIGDGLKKSGALDEGVGEAFDRVGDTAGRRLSESLSDSLEGASDPITEASERIGESAGDRMAEGMRRAAQAQLAADGPADWMEAGDDQARIRRQGEDNGNVIAQAMRRAALAQLAANGPADWIEATQDDGRVGNVFTRMFGRLRGVFRREGEGGGGSFADGFSRGFSGKNPLSTMLKAIRIPPLAIIAAMALPAIGGALKAIGAYVIGLIAQIGYLSTAIAGLGAAAGGAFVGIAIGILPLMLAFKAATPELEAFKERMSEVGEEWKSVGAAAQLTLLPALERAFSSTTKLIPAFQRYAVEIGEIAGSTAEWVAGMLTSSRGQEQLNKILFGSLGVWQQLRRIVINFFGFLLPFLAAVQPLAVRFAESIGNIFEKMAEIAQGGYDDGSLTTTLTLWYDRAELVLRAFGDMLVAIWNTFKIGADVAQPFFDTFSTFMSDWRTFTESAEGQDRIREIFENALPVMQEVNGLLADIIRAIWEPIAAGDTEGLIGTLRTLRTDVLPAVSELASVLASNAGPALQDLMTVFTELLTVLAESDALGTFFDTLSTSLELFIRILETPVLGSAVGIFVSLFGAMKAINLVSFGLASKAISGLVAGLWSLSGAAAGLAAVKTAMAGLTGFAALKAGAGALGLFLIPLLKFIAIAALVVGAVMAIVWAFKNWDKIKEWVDKAWDAVWDFVTKLPGRIAGAATALWQWIQDAIPAAVAKIAEWGAAIGGWLADLPGLIWGWVSGAASALWEWISDAIPQVARWLGRMWLAYVKFLASLPGRILGFLAKAIPALVGWILDAIPMLVGYLGRFIGFIIGFLVSLPGRILGFAASLISSLIGWIVDAIPGLVANLGYFIGFILGWLLQLPIMLIGWLVQAGAALIGWIAEAVPGLLLNLGVFLLNIATWLIELPGKILGWIVAAIPVMINWVSDAVPQLVTKLGEFLGKVSDWVTGLPGKIWGWIKEAIPKMINWVTDAATQLPGKLGEFATNIWTWITTFTSELPGKFVEAIGAMADVGRDIVEGIWEGIKNAKDWLMGLIGDFAGGIISGFADALKIWSPSRVMADRIGLPIAQGLGVGMENGIKRNVLPSIDRLSRDVVGRFSSGISMPITAPVSMGDLAGGRLSVDPASINAGTMAVSVQVKIGDRDITDIVDVRISDHQDAYTRQVYARGVHR